MSLNVVPAHNQSRTALYLLFRIDNDFYAIAAAEIQRVLKRQRLKQIPCLPNWVAGMLEFDRRLVPVVDIYQRMLNRPASEKSSTRLVMVRYDGDKLLGLLLEKVNTFERLTEQGWMEVAVNMHDNRFMASVQQHATLGLIQHIDLRYLLPADVHELLYAATADSEPRLSDVPTADADL